MQVQGVKTYGDYQIVCTLGKGNFGKVKLAKRDNNFVAIKLSRNAPAQILDQNNQLLLKQIKILKDLSHPHLIKYIDSHIDWKYVKQNGEQSSRLGLIIEYLPSNQLMEILQGGALGSHLSRYYFRQLIDALDYLHSNSVVHRDLKPQNILFDTNFNLKVTDFGLATIVEKTQPTTNCGTASYKSPQMLLKVPYNGISNDLFAAGIILFNMMTARSPFQMANPLSGLYRWIATNEHNRFWGYFEKLMPFEPQFKDLINSMFSVDPTQRLTIAQIKSHPWYIKQQTEENKQQGNTLISEADDFKRKIQIITRKKTQIRMKKLKTKKDSKSGHPLLGQSFRNMDIESEVTKPTIFSKKVFNKFGIKSTDIFIQTIKDSKGFLKLLSQISSDVRVLPNGKFQVQIQKVYQNQKFIGILSILQVDQKIDCLRLNCISGNIAFYYDYLNELNLLFEQA